MIKPKMLGHLVIRVRDAQRSEDFYTKVLGLEVRGRARGGKMRFFTSNPEIDHEIAVAEIGEDAVGPFPDQVGLYHMAWELADMDELKDAYQVVLDNNVDIAGFGDHGVTKGLYIRDPDGIETASKSSCSSWLPNSKAHPSKRYSPGGRFRGRRRINGTPGDQTSASLSRIGFVPLCVCTLDPLGGIDAPRKQSGPDQRRRPGNGGR